MYSNPWLRFLKTSLIFVLAYLLLASAFTIIIIIRSELRILDAQQVLSLTGQSPQQGVLRGQVRNIFGDPVPHAVVLLENRFVQGDNTGRFEISNLNPGRYTLEILAGGYEKYRREVQVETGINNPPFKYETGLWPQTFLVDFHLFYQEDARLLGIMGFANGSSQPLFIQSALLFNPLGEMILDLLADNGGFSYYAGLSNKLEIAEEPQRALKWAPRMWQSGEFPPIEGFYQPGIYTLKVYYGFEEEHQSGQYRVFTISDHLDLEKSW
ncbi:MAG: carboxypeptidase regulatory-like domain-containing protein, partial [Firmicutes bacterium]|nr:carboxypeptidase regulatory-like domain-containing protein [Bacillota bacterium]